MNEYPPAQDPNSQPPSSYPQYPPQPQYPQYPTQPQYPPYAPQPYGQPGYPVPPPGYAPPPYAPPARRSPTPLILGGIVAVVVIVALVLLVVRPFGSSSVSGTWYGAGTTGSTGDSAETFSLETYLTLTQSGTTVSGSGELCSLGSSDLPFNITGTLNGSTLTMTWALADDSSGAGSDDVEHVTGQFTNNALALSSNDSSGYYRSTLKHGSHAAFTAACASVTA